MASGRGRRRGIVRHAVESGITLFDTADMYSDGLTEEITGRLLSKLFAHRDDYVLAAKVYYPMGSGPNDRGLSRKHILSAIDGSLRRLGTDNSICTRSTGGTRIRPLRKPWWLCTTWCARARRATSARRACSPGSSPRPSTPQRQRLLSKPAVTAPIVGATKTVHLDDAVAALDVTLSDDEVIRLEVSYTPKKTLGHV